MTAGLPKFEAQAHVITLYGVWIYSPFLSANCKCQLRKGGHPMKNRTNITLIIATLIVLFNPVSVQADSDFEFYFFGVNLKSFKDSNAFTLVLGAAASVLVHEIGHSLYLQSQGMSYNLQRSMTGFVVNTDENLSDDQMQNFGRAGFALQTGVGTLLSSFNKTRHSDFTKGWTMINAVEVYTYNQRHQDDANDFKMIERGHGNGEQEYSMFVYLSSYNLARTVENVSVTNYDSLLFLNRNLVTASRHTKDVLPAISSNDNQQEKSPGLVLAAI
jgi:hypothetical protein